MTGRVALVTGAGKGIGRGIALSLAQAGATVSVNYSSDGAAADRTVSEILDRGGAAIAVQGDVGKPEEVDRLFTETRGAFGPVDTLVNNAARYTFQPLEEITVEEFDRQYRTTVISVILTSQAFLRQIPASGGSIVNISTSGITSNYPGSALYTSTKGALTSLTKVLANELGPRNVRVNALAPGATDTEGAHEAGLMTDESVARILGQTPLGRLGRPSDIGSVVAHLASSDAAWLTGEVIFASGGLR